MSKKYKNYVYFIKELSTGFVKIGKSNSPKNRLKSLQNGSATKLKLIKVIDGGLYLESALHVYFKDIRKHNEWFKPNYELNLFLNNKGVITTSTLLEVVYDNISSSKRKYLLQLSKTRPYV